MILCKMHSSSFLLCPIPENILKAQKGIFFKLKIAVLHQNTLHTFHSTLPSMGLGFSDGSEEQSGVNECMLLIPGWFLG